MPSPNYEGDVNKQGCLFPRLSSQKKKSPFSFLALVVAVQVLFWFFSSPGPQIAGETGLAAGVVRCIAALVILGAIPFAWVRLRPDTLDWEPLAPGDRRVGGMAVAVLLPFFLVATFSGSDDPQIRDFYPVPGNDIGNSAWQMAIWFAAYLMFYIAFEYFYRGFLLGGFAHLGMQKAIAIQALFCIVFHVGKPWIEVLGCIPASLVLGWLAWRTRSIWYSVAIHYLVGISNDLGSLWQEGLLFPAD
jgi:uncharacterized protein